MNRLEDTDTLKNAFEISGPLIECITAVCQGPNDANKWVELLTGDTTPPIKPRISNVSNSMTSSAVNFSPSSSHVSNISERLTQKIFVRCDNKLCLFSIL